MIGCEGLMRPDKYRIRKGPFDKAEVCHNPFCGIYFPHRVDTKGCFERVAKEVRERG
jgi:hypothetical protein